VGVLVGCWQGEDRGKERILINKSSAYALQLEEPILLLGKDRFSAVDIRVRVNGGGHIAQIYGKGEFRDQGDAKWIVIRRLVRGHNDTPFGRSISGRPIGCPGVGRPHGVFGGFSYY
jgi:hypothetical protein